MDKEQRRELRGYCPLATWTCSICNKTLVAKDFEVWKDIAEDTDQDILDQMCQQDVDAEAIAKEEWVSEVSSHECKPEDILAFQRVSDEMIKSAVEHLFKIPSQPNLTPLVNNLEQEVHNITKDLKTNVNNILTNLNTNQKEGSIMENLIKNIMAFNPTITLDQATALATQIIAANPTATAYQHLEIAMAQLNPSTVRKAVTATENAGGKVWKAVTSRTGLEILGGVILTGVSAVWGGSVLSMFGVGGTNTTTTRGKMGK